MSLDQRTHDLVLPADQSGSDAQPCRVGGHPLDPGHPSVDAQRLHAGVDSLFTDPTDHDIRNLLVGEQPLDPGQSRNDAHSWPAGVDSLPADRCAPDARFISVGGHPLDPGHARPDAHTSTAGVDSLPADHVKPDAPGRHVGGHPLDPGQDRLDAHTSSAGVDLLFTDHNANDAQARHVGEHPLPADQRTSDAQAGIVGGHPLDPGQAARDTRSRPAGVDPSPPPARCGAIPDDPAPGAELLLIYADALNDTENARVAAGNRIANLTNHPDDGGKGIDPDAPVVTSLKQFHDALLDVEKRNIATLERAMKAHPLGPWIKNTKGVGLKQGARLLAAIGDPYWNELHGRPRTVSELWAYSGLHVWHPVPSSSDTGHGAADNQREAAGVAPHRRKGVKCNWSTDAKTRALLIVESCIKQLRKPCAKVDDEKYALHVDGCACSPYRVLYDEARVKYRDRVHDDGTPYSDGHKHNMARRLVAKRILRDLWREAKRLSETS